MNPVLTLIVLVIGAAILWRIAKFVAKLLLVAVAVLAIYFFFFQTEAEASSLADAQPITTNISTM